MGRRSRETPSMPISPPVLGARDINAPGPSSSLLAPPVARHRLAQADGLAHPASARERDEGEGERWERKLRTLVYGRLRGLVANRPTGF